MVIYIINVAKSIPFNTWCLLDRKTARIAIGSYFFFDVRYQKLSKTLTKGVSAQIFGFADAKEYAMTLIKNNSLDAKKIIEAVIEREKMVEITSVSRISDRVSHTILLSLMDKHMNSGQMIMFAKQLMYYQNPLRDAKTVLKCLIDSGLCDQKGSFIDTR